MSKGKKAKAKRKVAKQQGYLLAHDKLGVLLGFMEIPGEEEDQLMDIPLFSNFEPGGRAEALILRSDLKLYSVVDRVVQQSKHFGTEGFQLIPVTCKQGELYLPMAKCRELGVPEWHAIPTDYYSAGGH